ncbi:efflux RND transporter periplasmic adaptor subunit [Pseudoalteromonas luteoviolacea]|uniref:efflux RND transporter periplasmic adaptor subunit n=1 Tax=Pseudoalteromonas luteoviolacea TaxID=43657 RepID=UPI001150FFE9|nr:efflux RND transporter periplasmic adaptor subunit [Pseudoalteromonas luteoviolacea]TQF71725.1 efflux RND transporter periplasmic adaptor subunit [Pseudoalteromonas luteoviolacea]
MQNSYFSVKLFSLALACSTAIYSIQSHAALPVTVEPVTQAPLTSSLAVNGTLFGKKDVVLTAGISGRVLYVAEPGERVSEGEILVKMDTLPLELDQARQKEMLNRAQVNLRFHKQELNRLKRLAKSNSAAATQVDSVQNQHDLALSDIALAKIELKVIADQLERATIRAPFSGVVSERFKRAGREVSRADELLNFVDIDNLETRLYVPVKYLHYLKPGITLPIQAGNLDTPLKAQAIVTSVIPATDPRSQTVEVRAKLEKHASQTFAVGQLVDVTVPLRSLQAKMLINRDALIIRKQGVHIVKVSPDNTVLQVPVEVGKGEGSLVAITPLDADALKIGDSIAVRGAERLTDGQEVEVQPLK